MDGTEQADEATPEAEMAPPEASAAPTQAAADAVEPAPDEALAADASAGSATAEPADTPVPAVAAEDSAAQPVMAALEPAEMPADETPTALADVVAATEATVEVAPEVVTAAEMEDVPPAVDAEEMLAVAPEVVPAAEVADVPPAVDAEEMLAVAPEVVAPAEVAATPPALPAARVYEGPEPTTMEELLNEQATEIRSLKHGDVVEGSIVRIDKDEILVDIGAKSEGVISNRELYGRNAESQPQLNIGDVVLVYVLQPESPEGHAVLSLRRAGLERKWRSMQEQLDAGVIIEAPVIDHNKGGLIVDCGIRGFVPISQIVDFPRRPQNEQPRDAAQEIAEKLQPYVGRKLRLKILEVNRKANRLILSEKVALYEERREKRDELFSSLQVGQKVTGTVRSIAPFGVFVDLGGIDGLVHKSELSWNKVNNPEAGYQVGEQVEAEVIDINHERGRISLSIRRLQPDPWHSTVADMKVGDVIDGTVTKIVNFGAFVRVRDGLEGLIHISELSHARVAHPGDVVHEGQTIKLKIISLDQERHRLGLSLKQAEEAPPRPEPAQRERRPRQERSYDMSQAVQEPEGGIDNTLAAAFAQVRQQIEQTEAARGETIEEEPAATAAAEVVAAATAEVAEAEPAEAEPAAAPEPRKAAARKSKAKAEAASESTEPAAEPVAEPAAEATASATIEEVEQAPSEPLVDAAATAVEAAPQPEATPEAEAVAEAAPDVEAAAPEEPTA